MGKKLKRNSKPSLSEYTEFNIVNLTLVGIGSGNRGMEMVARLPVPTWSFADVMQAIHDLSVSMEPEQRATTAPLSLTVMRVVRVTVRTPAGEIVCASDPLKVSQLYYFGREIGAFEALQMLPEMPTEMRGIAKFVRAAGGALIPIRSNTQVFPMDADGSVPVGTLRVVNEEEMATMLRELEEQEAARSKAAHDEAVAALKEAQAEAEAQAESQAQSAEFVPASPKSALSERMGLDDVPKFELASSSTETHDA